VRVAVLGAMTHAFEQVQTGARDEARDLFALLSWGLHILGEGDNVDRHLHLAHGLAPLPTADQGDSDRDGCDEFRHGRADLSVSLVGMNAKLHRGGPGLLGADVGRAP
jgi:hypothetical protein